MESLSLSDCVCINVDDDSSDDNITYFSVVKSAIDSDFSEARKFSSRNRSSRSFGYMTKRQIMKSNRWKKFKNMQKQIKLNLKNCIIAEYLLMKKIVPKKRVKTILGYNPTPLIIISSKLIDEHIGFSNTIILKQPRFSNQKRNEIVYDADPLHIGLHLQMYKDSKAQTMVKYDPYQNGSAMSIHNVPAKKVLLVAKWSELKPLIDDMKEFMLPICFYCILE